MKNTIVIFYSRTGASRLVAEALAQKLGCRTAEVFYPGRGKVGYWEAFKQAMFKRSCDFECDIKARDLSGSGRVIFVFPIWVFTLCAPIRNFMRMHKTHIGNYELIATAGGSGLRTCVKASAEILGAAPQHSVMLRDADIRAGKINLPEWVR